MNLATKKEIVNIATRRASLVRWDRDDDGETALFSASFERDPDWITSLLDITKITDTDDSALTVVNKRIIVVFDISEMLGDPNLVKKIPAKEPK